MIFQIYKNGDDIQLSIRPKNSIVNLFIGSCNKKTDENFTDNFDNFKDWNAQLVKMGIEIKSIPQAYELLISNLKDEKKAEINSQKETNLSRSVLYKLGGIEHYFQRDVKAELSWTRVKKSGKTYQWITEGNKIVVLSEEAIESICNHIEYRDTTESIQARKRKDALLLLKDAQEIEAFDITQVFEQY